jgi:mannan endo-1,4-beta-mannosidase
MKCAYQLLLAATIQIFSTSTGVAQFADFITARGDKLFEGDHELRFISVNIPNLHYLEDYLPFKGTNPWRLPDEFEIRDALTAVKQLGGKVARVYVFSVRKEGDTPDIIRHVEGPGKFNEEAFRTFDKVLQVANEVGIRLIIPFVDNWHWWGGPVEYAAFRGKKRDDFWRDPQLIADFKKTIEFVVNRKNTYTGIAYKDDKAILAWETGNELLPPFSWTREIAAYVKGIDKNHLLMEGVINPDLSEDALNDPNLDILSSHHYRDPSASLRHIIGNRELSKGKKPYLVGEYGIVSTEDIRILTDTIINQGLVGGMIWSLRYRNREGGFYHHYEYNNVESYRWPGYSSGDLYDEQPVLTLLREKAHQIDGTAVPRLPVPGTPTLLGIKDIAEISWQGSAGSTSYVIERRNDQDTSWAVVGDGVDESRYQYSPLFTDESAQMGRSYFYRVRAKNQSGISAPSNVVGPVAVDSKTIVDEMEGFDKIFQKDGSLKLLTFQDLRKAKEDRSRLTGSDGSYIVYKVPPSIFDIAVGAFTPDSSRGVQLYVSSNLSEFTEVKAQKETFRFGKNDYGFFEAVGFHADNLPAGAVFVKIVFNDGVQIGRIELKYR